MFCCIQVVVSAQTSKTVQAGGHTIDIEVVGAGGECFACPRTAVESQLVRELTNMVPACAGGANDLTNQAQDLLKAKEAAQ